MTHNHSTIAFRALATCPPGRRAVKGRGPPAPPALVLAALVLGFVACRSSGGGDPPPVDGPDAHATEASAVEEAWLLLVRVVASHPQWLLR